MYLYFDRAGTLKEIINTQPARQGSVNKNDIYVYWEGSESISDLIITGQFKLPSGIVTNDVNATKIIPSQTDKESIIPYDEKQDLRFFKYFTPYLFYKITAPVEALSESGSVLFLASAYDSTGRLELSPVPFYVKETLGEIAYKEYLDISQYYYLRQLLNGKLDSNTTSVIVDSLPDKGESNVIYYLRGQASGTPYQIYIWNGSAWNLLGEVSGDFASKEEQKLFENAINKQIAQIRNEVVNPFVVVATESDLPSTNEGKIYVVVDTESWYYWNGSAYVNGGTFAQVSLDAINVSYNGTESGLYANNVQSAIDELVVEKLDKNGYSALAHVGLADNIASPDGITDNAEFAFRASGGTNSIADGFAEIKRLKGRTWIVNQLCNPTLTTRTENGIEITNNGDGSFTLNGTATQTFSISFNLLSYESAKLIKDHKYLLSGNLSTDNPGLKCDAFNDNGEGVIGTATADTAGRSIYVYVNGGYTFNNIVYKPRLIDLTKMFGAGKEPATVAQFNNLTRGLSFATYHEGTFLNMNAEALESTGFNAFDGTMYQVGINNNTGNQFNSNVNITSDYIPVVCGETYTWSEDTKEGWKNRYVYCYDKDHKYIRSVRFGFNTVAYHSAKLPDNCCFVRISYYDDTETQLLVDQIKNICFHLTHSGYRNGQYEPYVKNTRTFYDVETYFPSGMRSAGSAYDEMTPTKARKRIESVDLGTPNWYYETSTQRFYTGQAIEGAKLPANSDTKANILCSLYQNGTISDVKNNDNTICLYKNGSLYIKDTSCPDVQSLLAKINGKPLYYELAEPIIYDIDTDEEWTYPVSDFGTEKAVDGAFLSADIFYMNNLRDKLRNLPDIPKCSETGTHVLKCINGTYTWVEE